MTDKTKIVWVLGAGFSMPLGGPGLSQLLSPASGADFEARFPGSELTSPDAAAVRALYAYGCRYALGRPVFGGTVWAHQNGGEYLWDHAESFLDWLDAWATDGGEHTFQRLTHILGGIDGWKGGRVNEADLERLNQSARRLVAAECSVFVVDAEVSSEVWEPYVQWTNELSEDDTIITFNYDRVLEEIGDRCFVIPIPGGVDTGEKSDRSIVLKLHGSVDWEVENDREHRIVRLPSHKAKKRIAIDGSAPAIATPGRSKRRWTESFDPLWAAARTALQHAHHVVFIGYRFPPTDAFARSSLLGAIERNKVVRGLHVVLGPNTHDPDIVRLQALLSYSVSPTASINTHGVVRVHPLWSQDFLSLYKRELLLRG